MSRIRLRWPAWTAVAALYLLHNDLWLWDDPRRLLGLPVGLTYHVLYCVAAAALMALLVRRSGGGEGSG
ncbi:MAG: DUF3311 domain-containing protein [Thermoanaerobaculia bacterium]|nr:DUF3311 domain-containing protein [Thermoanaerobaculia bacterium]